jgi:GntR family transcriptional regulator, transcriptional repressor for pyruvate dehydrogenase complex
MPVHSEPAASPTADQLSGALGGSIDAVSAVSEVTRRLLTYFTSDAIQPGDRLPPERQLALTLGIGRSAVREALAALEILGVVTVRPGSGTYLRGKASELLPQTLSWGMLIGTPEAIAEIGRHLETMADTIEDYKAFVAADMRFHQAVAAAAQNTLLADLLQTARSLLRVWVERALDDLDQAHRTLAEHRAVYDALTAGNRDQAAAAMNTHMDSAAERLTGFLAAS